MVSRFFFLFITLLALSVNAHAYIDPGSGSALMSIIIGFFVAIGVGIKVFWYKILSLLGLGSKKKPDNVGKDKKER